MRGVSFRVAGSEQVPSRWQDWVDAGKALNELAEALGYGDCFEYVSACEHRPREVRRRLKALRPGRVPR